MNVSNASGSLMRRPDVKLSQLVDISALQLDTSLSEIGTLERKLALKKEELQEAKLSQLLAVPSDIPGLKTLTQKDLIDIVENNWNRDQQVKNQDRKVLGWSSGEDSDGTKTKELDKLLNPNDIVVQISPKPNKRAGNQIKIENEQEHDEQSHV